MTKTQTHSSRFERLIVWLMARAEGRSTTGTYRGTRTGGGK